MNYFVFITISNFLLSMNWFADFFKFFKSRLLIEIPGYLPKLFVNNETLRKPIAVYDYLFSMIS